ncbi:hypothetical protein [Streptomyces murinus]|uniref:hypothetical protein n=1 Tax=Streptomyces murinus TaxID=33900 RepID=UPI0038105E01
MPWSVVVHPDAARRLERLILPDEALADGRLITPPHVAAAAGRRRALFDMLVGRLGREPHAGTLGTVHAQRPHHRGTTFASVLQDDTEALHAWWEWHGLGASIQILDLTYTPSLRHIQQGDT